MTTPFPDSPAFRRYTDLLLDLHRRGDDIIDEDHPLWDALNAGWEALTDDERTQATGLDADLGWVLDGPIPGELSAEDVKPEELAQLKNLVQQGEFGVELLRLMRDCYPAVRPDQIAGFRGHVWADHHYHAIAHVFFDHAAKLNADEPAYSALMVFSFYLSDPAAGFAQAKAHVQRQPPAPLGVRVGSLRCIGVAFLRPALLTPELLRHAATTARKTAQELKRLKHVSAALMLADTCLVGWACYLRAGQLRPARELLELGLAHGSGPALPFIQRILAAPEEAPHLLEAMQPVLERSRNDLAA